MRGQHWIPSRIFSSSGPCSFESHSNGVIFSLSGVSRSVAKGVFRCPRLGFNWGNQMPRSFVIHSNFRSSLCVSGQRTICPLCFVWRRRRSRRRRKKERKKKERREGRKKKFELNWCACDRNGLLMHLASSWRHRRDRQLWMGRQTRINKDFPVTLLSSHISLASHYSTGIKQTRPAFWCDGGINQRVHDYLLESGWRSKLSYPVGRKPR